MEVKVKEEPNWQRVVEVDVPASEFTDDLTRALRDYQRKVKLQGFRPGKAPLHIVKRLYGPQIEADTIEKILPRFIESACEIKNLDIVSSPRVTDIRYQPGSDLNFSFSVDVRPVFEIKKYEAFKFEKMVYEASEEDINNALDALRREQAVWKTDEGPIAENHFVMVDFQELDNAGVPLIGQKFENQMVSIQSEAGEVNELGKQLLGAAAGETRPVILTTRQGDDPKAPTEPKRFMATIKEIRLRILPELDDEFAKDVGDYESLDDLKSGLRERITRNMQQQFDERLHHEIIDEIIKANPFEVPASMIEQYLDIFVNQIKQGNGSEIDEAAVRQEYRAGAIWNIKWRLIRRRLAEANKIEVADAEIQALVEQHAAAQQADAKRLWNRVKNDEDALYRFRTDILEKKVMDFLISRQKIKEKNVTRKDLEKKKILEP